MMEEHPFLSQQCQARSGCWTAFTLQLSSLHFARLELQPSLRRVLGPDKVWCRCHSSWSIHRGYRTLRSFLSSLLWFSLHSGLLTNGAQSQLLSPFRALASFSRSTFTLLFRFSCRERLLPHRKWGLLAFWWRLVIKQCATFRHLKVSFRLNQFPCRCRLAICWQTPKH